MTSPTPTSRNPLTRYAQILVPVDFSQLGWNAVPIARVLASSFDAPLRLVHVVSGSPSGRNGAGGTQEHVVGRESVEVDVVDADTVDDGIVGALRDDGSSLVVMSTHGRTAAAELALGSVAERVLRRSSGAAVVTGPQYAASAAAPTRIVLCVAPSADPPPELVDDARFFARRLAVPVKVLMVTDRPAPIPFDFELIRAQLRRIEPVAAALAADGAEVDIAHLQGGGAIHEIVTYADAQPGTVIAMATHARTPVSRFLLGSRAVGVLRRAKSPVLLRRYGVESAG